MSSPQVAIYKYVGTEWEKTNIEGTLFVYERKCEPCFGFLVLNRLSTTNLIQPITKDIELQDKTPFLLYKTKEIHGIWFYESNNCQKLFVMMNSVIDKLKNTKKEISDKGNFKQAAPGVKVGGSGRIGNSNNGEISLADLLHNAGNKERPANTNNHETSPSGGEKLMRLLSVSESHSEQRDDENKENGGSVAAFFAQVSQASSTVVGPPPPGLPAAARMNPLQSLFTDPAVVSVEALEKHRAGPPPPGLPAAARMNPLQSLFTDPAVVSVEALEKQPQSAPMPPLPVAAKVISASDLESDLKPTKAKRAGHGANKTTNKNKPAKPVENDKSLNNGPISYASVAGAAQPPPTEITAPQLMSPMVFAGQDHQSSPGPVVGPVVQTNNVPMIPPPVLPLNGIPFHLPVPVPQVTPLTEAQLLQGFQHLLRTDRGFVSKLHQAYVESLNTQLH